MRLALALGAVVLALGAPASAAATRGSLPSPTAPVRNEPPLRTPVPRFSFTERRFPQRLDTTVVVRVGLDSSGRPVQMTALDRVVVNGTGDYAFAIPAPALSVVAGPGSASQPGLRSGNVLWQGFSANQRVLAAQITLDPQRAAKALPLGVAIERGEVRLVNVTTTTARVITGPTPVAAVADAVAAARAGVEKHQLVPASTITFTGPTHTQALEVRARLRVTGSYRFGDGKTQTVAAWLGKTPLRLTGRGELRQLALRVVADDPATPLRPTGRIDLAERRLLGSALAAQYQSFLANPDPAGPNATTYRFHLAGRVSTSAGNEAGGSGPWLAIGFALAAVVAAAGGVVAWAHA